MSKIHPVKKTRPAIKNWCFKPTTIEQCPQCEECEPGFKKNEETGEFCNCETGECDCPSGTVLKEETGKCGYPPGKVLLQSVVFRGFQALPESQGLSAVLFGEHINNFPQGVSCNFTTDIQTHYSDGKITIADQQSLGRCYEVDKTYFKNAILKCNI